MLVTKEALPKRVLVSFSVMTHDRNVTGLALVPDIAGAHPASTLPDFLSNSSLVSPGAVAAQVLFTFPGPLLSGEAVTHPGQ